MYNNDGKENRESPSKIGTYIATVFHVFQEKVIYMGRWCQRTQTEKKTRGHYIYKANYNHQYLPVKIDRDKKFDLHDLDL